MGNSSSASLAASLLIRRAREHPAEAPLFKGAIFFSGIAPVDTTILRKHEVRFLNHAAVDTPITIPTANIWAANDERHRVHSAVLSKLCSVNLNEELIHANGSTIPGAGEEATLVRAALAIRKTVDRAIIAL